MLDSIQLQSHPILFNAEMIIALLSGRKTQTRRILKPQPATHYWEYLDGYRMDQKVLQCSDGLCCRFTHSIPNGVGRSIDEPIWVKCKHGNIGDLLWVRENMKEDCLGSISLAQYSADGRTTKHEWWKPVKYCPSIHMPRRLSRITLKITDIRVERVQDISAEDAIREGIANGPYAVNPVTSYKTLWNSINGNWDENPWVWAIGFEVIKKNIDDYLKSI